MNSQPLSQPTEPSGSSTSTPLSNRHKPTGKMNREELLPDLNLSPVREEIEEDPLDSTDSLTDSRMVEAAMKEVKIQDLRKKRIFLLLFFHKFILFFWGK